MIWHLATNWLTGHWLFAVIALLVLLVCCVPTISGPLLRFLFTTRPGLVGVAALVMLGWGSWYGADRYAAGVHDTQAAAKTQVDAANLKASEAARSEERALDGVIHSAQVAYERGKADAHASVAGVLDAVARGDYVLRSGLRCPAQRPAGAVAANPGAAPGAAPEAWGVSGADVQFLVRFAGDADDVSADLRLCRDTLAAERARAAGVK